MAEHRRNLNQVLDSEFIAAYHDRTFTARHLYATNPTGSAETPRGLTQHGPMGTFAAVFVLGDLSRKHFKFGSKGSALSAHSERPARNSHSVFPFRALHVSIASA